MNKRFRFPRETVHDATQLLGSTLYFLAFHSKGQYFLTVPLPYEELHSLSLLAQNFESSGSV